MTHEKVIEMIDEYMLQDNINEEWVEALKVCRQSLLDVESQKAEIERLQSMNQAKLDTIHDLMTEIERLQKAGEDAVNCFTRMESLYKIKCKELEVAKSEAYREFDKNFKEKSSSVVTSCQGKEIYETKQYQISAVDFDNLVKELTGDNNG